LFDALIDADVTLFNNIKVFVFGGEAASFLHVKKAYENLPETILLNGYGPTENSTFTLVHKVTKEDFERGFIPIGEPVSETECFVLNENLEVLEADQEGVLFTSGKGLAIGYTNEIETNKKFVFHPTLQKRLYNVGDRVKYHKNIGYQYLGRIDRQVKIRGFRIELIEVENAMLKCSDVSVGIAVFNKVLQKNELAVFYSTFSKKPIDEKILKNQLAGFLSEYAIPSHFFFCK
jgi:non-ribosomal peptide synthetase component F